MTKETEELFKKIDDALFLILAAQMRDPSIFSTMDLIKQKEATDASKKLKEEFSKK